MKLIRKLGIRKVISKNKKEYTNSFGIFLCSYCNREVEKVLAIGRKSKSCGCAREKLIGEYQTKHGYASSNNKRHKLYTIWDAMKQRCYNKNNCDYKNYGGRGIKVCNEWRNDFVKFKDWALANGYKKGLTIDRINNNRKYHPRNCRWATYKEQNRNTRSNHILSFRNETHCITKWAEILGISRETLYYRINLHKWSIEKALTTKVRKYKRKEKYINE